MAKHCIYLKFKRFRWDTRTLICTKNYKEFESERVCLNCKDRDDKKTNRLKPVIIPKKRVIKKTKKGVIKKAKKRVIEKTKKRVIKITYIGYAGRQCPICKNKLKKGDKVTKIEWRPSIAYRRSVLRFAHVKCVKKRVR